MEAITSILLNGLILLGCLTQMKPAVSPIWTVERQQALQTWNLSNGTDIAAGKAILSGVSQ